MRALVQLHWSIHRSSILFTLALITLFNLFFYKQSSEVTNILLAISLAGGSARMSFAPLKGTNRHLLYALPIPRTTIVKSVYVVNFLISTVVFLLVAPMQIVSGLLQDSLFTYVFAWSGFYCGCLLGTLLFVIIYLEHTDSGNSVVAFITLFSGFALTFAPHTLLSFFVDSSAKWLFVAITPISILIAYYMLMQRGVKKFTQLEPF